MARHGSSTSKRLVVAAAVVGLGVVLLWLVVWWNRPPQMGADEDVFRTVDALFTAVTAHDETRLGQCAQRLHAYREAGKLPADASDYLAGVIHKARAGGWESAAERLYGFMTAQRREGRRESAPKQHQRRRARQPRAGPAR